MDGKKTKVVLVGLEKARSLYFNNIVDVPIQRLTKSI